MLHEDTCLRISVGDVYKRQKDNSLLLYYVLSDEKAHSQKEISEEWMVPRTTLNTAVSYTHLWEPLRSFLKQMKSTEKYMNLRYGEVKRMNKKQNGKPKLSKDTLKTAKRLLKYVTETYKMRFILVFVCILISSVATISVSLSLKFLLDDFIIPLIGQQSPNFTELYRALEVLGCIFLLGVVSTFIYTRMMVYIGQGVLKKVRDDMFEHMQTLPIRYFDQRTNGSITVSYTHLEKPV